MKIQLPMDLVSDFLQLSCQERQKGPLLKPSRHILANLRQIGERKGGTAVFGANMGMFGWKRAMDFLKSAGKERGVVTRLLEKGCGLQMGFSRLGDTFVIADYPVGGDMLYPLKARFDNRVL